MGADALAVRRRARTPLMADPLGSSTAHELKIPRGGVTRKPRGVPVKG